MRQGRDFKLLQGCEASYADVIPVAVRLAGGGDFTHLAAGRPNCYRFTARTVERARALQDPEMRALRLLEVGQ